MYVSGLSGAVMAIQGQYKKSAQRLAPADRSADLLNADFISFNDSDPSVHRRCSWRDGHDRVALALYGTKLGYVNADAALFTHTLRYILEHKHIYSGVTNSLG